MRVEGASESGRETVVLLVVAAAVLAFLTAQAAVLVDRSDLSGFAWAAMAHGAVYLMAAVWVLRNPGGLGTIIVILVGALILRALAMTALPNLTTDALRYVWDGRLGWEGISPYLYVPADERLAHLRDTEIYPDINQKEGAVTIYPPVAQLIFMAGVAIHDGIGGMKAVMLGFEVVTIAALIGWLRSEGLPVSRILIYAWHPLPIWEFASQAHLDSAATAFLVLGIWAALSKRQGLTGMLFAFAALVKYFPVVLLPALWRRWNWRLPVALFATAVLFYLPYVFEAGGGVIGFLGQHLDNEGYGAGWGFHAVWLLRDLNLADPPGWQYVICALMILFGFAAWCVFQRGAAEFRPERVALLGAAFVFLTSPHYPWYFGFLCALAVRVPHPSLLVMTLLCISLNEQRAEGYSWTGYFVLTYYLPLAVWAVWEAGVRLSPKLARINDKLLRLPGENSRL